MVKFAKIQVVSPNGLVLFDELYRLPITIGRHCSATISIPDAPIDMSRIHVRLTAAKHCIVLNDESSLGTEYHGRIVNRGTLFLTHNDTFSIRNFLISVKTIIVSEDSSSIAQIYLKTLHGKNLSGFNNQLNSPHYIGKNNLICLLERSNEIKFEAVPVGAVNGNLLGSYNLSEIKMLFAIGRISQTEIAILTTDHADQHNILINKNKPKIGQLVNLKSFDLIEMLNIRMEVLVKKSKVME